MDRREFAKLVSTLPLLGLSPQWLSPPEQYSGQPAENVLLLVFDAWSAHDVSLYGYQRSTMPELERLAQRAVVFHHHHAGGPFTSPGTASLLTGLYPWSHRAFNANGLVSKYHHKHSFLSLFPQHYKIGYSHNNFAVSLLRQLGRAGIDQLVPLREMMLGNDFWVTGLFANDLDIAALSRVMSLSTTDYANSLLFPGLHKRMVSWTQQSYKQAYAQQFPRGLPETQDQINYILEHGIDWLVDHLPALPQPFFGYFHFLPPHDPYLSRSEFVGLFEGDGYLAPDKPDHLFSDGQSKGKMARERAYYDEFIAYVDAEFARLYHQMEAAGLLGNTWLVLTSDHGEMFERGIVGHSTEALHQPVIHIPLLVFPPGQQQRVDVHLTTSAVDVLPTMLHVTGQQVPDWCQGLVLPPFGDPQAVEERTVYAQHLRRNLPEQPLQHGTYIAIEGKYKLIYYTGWPELQDQDPYVELYDLENDPEEMDNLAIKEKEMADHLIIKILNERQRVDGPYLK